MRLLLLLALVMAGCSERPTISAPQPRGIVVNDGDGGSLASPTIRWGTPRDHGFGTRAWDVPIMVSGLPRDEAERAAANILIDVRGAEITSGWASGWGAYTCFGLPTPGVPQVSMSWLTGWGLVRMADGEMGCVVVNPSGGEVSVTLGARDDLPRFYWRVPGETNYREAVMTISGPRTMSLSR